jgi:hypothetical protein
MASGTTYPGINNPSGITMLNYTSGNRGPLNQVSTAGLASDQTLTASEGFQVLSKRFGMPIGINDQMLTPEFHNNLSWQDVDRFWADKPAQLLSNVMSAALFNERNGNFLVAVIAPITMTYVRKFQTNFREYYGIPTPPPFFSFIFNICFLRVGNFRQE